MSIAGQAIELVYCEDGRSHEPFQHLKICNLPFDVILERLREAIRTEDLMVLHEIDPQAILARSNYVIGRARQLFFFHPRLMARLLAADPSAVLEVPLKFSIVAGAQDHVSVRWLDPAASFARYGQSALEHLGHELAEICLRIVSRALNTN